MKHKILALAFILCGSIPILAITANQTVSINAKIVEVCILELNYSVEASTFEITDEKLRGLEPGNPLSYKTVSPNSTNGIGVTVYSNNRNGAKLEVGASDNFMHTVFGVSEQIPVGQLKWSSVRGGQSWASMGIVPTACFVTTAEGIVTDNIKYYLDLYSTNAFGEYESVITFTAINN